MVSLISSRSLLYALVAISTTLVAAHVLTLLTAFIYKVVVVFIALIILSNCAAKLYGRIRFKIDL